MNNNIGRKYLPIGTVVMLKGGSKRLMITGFCSMPTDDENEMYDYAGCMYPEGFLSSDQTALFNHDQIDKIYYMGLIDDEEKAFKQSLTMLVNHVNNQNVNTNQQVSNNINTNTNANTNPNQTEQVDITNIPPVGPGLPGYVAPQPAPNNTMNTTGPSLNNLNMMNQNMQINNQPMNQQMNNMQFDNNNNISA